MAKQIPDRWLDYKAIGDVVADSNFVAFKVPLHKRVCENLPLPDRHTTCDVIKALPQLGLVINLTNTQNDTKYYQPHDWQRFGVDYKWIKTEGHVTPSRQLLDSFCRTVQNFVKANPKKLVGVHCTHGLNRTGYFVCSYMVLCNNVSPSDAMRNFSVARGHPIERPNYINAIIRHASVERLEPRPDFDERQELRPGFEERQERPLPRADHRVPQVRQQPRSNLEDREDRRTNLQQRREPRNRYVTHEDPRNSSPVRQPAIVRHNRRPGYAERHERRRDSMDRQEPDQNRRIRRSRWQNDNSDSGWRTWVNTRMQNLDLENHKK